jgi:hypothetical protein
MQFKHLNEKGKIERIEAGEALFQFDYTNDFYGSCHFKSKIIQHRNDNLALDERSIVLENSDIRNGTAAAVLGIAKTFFKKTLNRHTSLSQLEDPRPSPVQKTMGTLKTGLDRFTFPKGSPLSLSNW